MPDIKDILPDVTFTGCVGDLPTGATSVLTDNGDGTYTHDDGNGNLTTITGDVSTLTDNGDGTYTHVAGGVTTIIQGGNTSTFSQDATTGVITHEDGDGNTNTAVTATVADDGNGVSDTITTVNGALKVAKDPVVNFVPNPSGCGTDAVTCTGAVVFTIPPIPLSDSGGRDIGATMAWYTPTATDPEASGEPNKLPAPSETGWTVLDQEDPYYTITNPDPCYPAKVLVTIGGRTRMDGYNPTFNTNAQILTQIQYNLDGGGWTDIQSVGYDSGNGGVVYETKTFEFDKQAIAFTIPAGGSRTIGVRLRYRNPSTEDAIYRIFYNSPSIRYILSGTPA